MFGTTCMPIESWQLARVKLAQVSINPDIRRPQPIRLQWLQSVTKLGQAVTSLPLTSIRMAHDEPLCLVRWALLLLRLSSLVCGVRRGGQTTKLGGQGWAYVVCLSAQEQYPIIVCISSQDFSSRCAFPGRSLHSSDARCGCCLPDGRARDQSRGRTWAHRAGSSHWRYGRHSRACEQLIQRCVFEYRARAGRNRACRCSTGASRTRNSQRSRQHANLPQHSLNRAKPVTNQLRAVGHWWDRWDEVGQALCCVACALPFVPLGCCHWWWLARGTPKAERSPSRSLVFRGSEQSRRQTPLVLTAGRSARLDCLASSAPGGRRTAGTWAVERELQARPASLECEKSAGHGWVCCAGLYGGSGWGGCIPSDEQGGRLQLAVVRN